VIFDFREHRPSDLGSTASGWPGSCGFRRCPASICLTVSNPARVATSLSSFGRQCTATVPASVSDAGKNQTDSANISIRASNSTPTAPSATLSRFVYWPIDQLSTRLSKEACQILKMSSTVPVANDAAEKSFGDLNLSIIGLGTEYPPYPLVPADLDTLCKRFYPESPAFVAPTARIHTPRSMTADNFAE
jgi:hypothetical protein